NPADRLPVRPEANEDVPALGLAADDQEQLTAHGWRVVGAGFTTDPWAYRDYIRASRGEFTVARDLHVRLKSGWFSEPSACYLIVNADDFGLSPGVNRGIVAAHEQGIVTSASLMVRWSAAAAAADYGRGHPALSLGLHLDFGEWAYRGGAWVRLYKVVSLDDP